MAIILALLVAVITFCGYLLMDAVMLDKKRRDSLRMRISPDGQVNNADLGDDSAYLARELSPKGQRIMNLLRSLGVQTDAAFGVLEQRCARAGISSADAPAYYLLFERIISVIICSLMLLMVVTDSSDDPTLTYALAAIVVGLAIFGPALYLKNKMDHRRQVLLRAFPDTLDLLLICVEAGLALDAALNRICGELGRAHPDMADELNRTRFELSLLNDRVKALSNLAERTDMPAFQSLVSALVQSERFGTSLSDTLRVLADDFRLQRMTDAEARAARVPVLMTVPLILLLLPALIIIILGPAIVSSLRTLSS